MKNIDLRNKLKLNKVNSRLQNVMSEWKLAVPLIISLVGLFIGTLIIKGEESVYSKAGYYIENYILNEYSQTFYIRFIIHLLIPTTFAFIMFFLGLSVYGGLIVSIIPFIFNLFSGIITYYMFSEYTLKGLAYCVIMLFPYLTLSLYALIVISGECITMSQYILCNLSIKRIKAPDYSIKKYYSNTVKSYSYILIGALIKTLIEGLFVGLFSF